MASSSFLKLLGFVAVYMVVVACTVTEADVTCGQVASYLTPCLSYARGNGAGPVPGPCCSGMKSLNSVTVSLPDRQAVCKCLKAISAGTGGINFGVVANAPGKCGVSIPYKMSPSTDCSRV